MTEREADRLKRLEDFQTSIGYVFSDPSLLEEALTHSSYAHEHGLSGWNERLEFLGDAVLELIVSEQLFRDRPAASEGQMTQERSSLVREEVLSAWGHSMGLGGLLMVGRGLRGNATENMIGDAVEAIIGALYLDGGADVARSFVASRPTVKAGAALDPKSLLQISVQKDGSPAPRYELVSRGGTDHEPLFTVRAWFGEEKSTTGVGTSRKAAEQDAARKALEIIEIEMAAIPLASDDGLRP